MPDLNELGLEGSPTLQPETYPGGVVTRSCLLVERWVYDLDADQDRRVGQWRARIDGGPLASAARSRQGREHVNYMLLMANAAAMDFRYPVLAIGSNSAPAQLLGKFESSGVSTVVPMTMATVRGLQRSLSAHVSRPGYVPYVLVRAPDDQSLTLPLLWLDRYQLARMTATEPNYELVSIDGAAHALVLESGERLGRCGLYRGRWGALSWSPGGPSAPATDQIDAFERLASYPWFDALVPGPGRAARVARLAERPDLREEVRQELQRQQMVQPDGIDVVPGDQQRYGALLPAQPRSAGEYVVHPTPEELDRRGEQYVLLHPTAPALSHGHVVVADSRRPDAPSAVARAVADAEVPTDSARVDQSVRNGVGVEIGDSVTLRPASVRRTAIADLVISPRAYFLCRVQVAALPIVEQPVCTIDPSALQILGIGDGDVVVIEGTPAEGVIGVPWVRLKAFATSTEVAARREALAGGDLSSRFPDANDALGVHPDLPWIFLDQGARSALGLRDQKLALVRVRASRRHQIGKEARETLFVLVLAFVGLLSILRSVDQIAAATLVLIVLVLVVMQRRVRLRLARRIYRREQDG